MLRGGPGLSWPRIAARLLLSLTPVVGCGRCAPKRGGQRVTLRRFGEVVAAPTYSHRTPPPSVVGGAHGSKAARQCRDRWLARYHVGDQILKQPADCSDRLCMGFSMREDRRMK